ncbi:hypothetical protein A4H97_15490 [Niastella yeongjuensis]|uniref:Uncharacterized protein n=1 Tax=Niastella yeongjuensis TaxID=354355 RepID=A0A1V9E4K8_9BACT|nr:hypothetical protein A4H97_15490 [Niastella yeongjuensis]
MKLFGFDTDTVRKGRRQSAEGRVQKAECRGQRAEGRGQKAEGRRQRAEGREGINLSTDQLVNLSTYFSYLTRTQSDCIWNHPR